MTLIMCPKCQREGLLCACPKLHHADEVCKACSQPYRDHGKPAGQAAYGRFCGAFVPFVPALMPLTPNSTVAEAIAAATVTTPAPEKAKESNPKEAFGSDKIPLGLWPTTATAAGAMAFLHGALKYGKNNWRAVGVRSSTYHDALQRHIAAWWEGEDCDPDSGLSHLAHALACIAVLVDAEAAGELNDDRAYPGGYEALAAELTPMVRRMKDEAKGKPEPKHYTKGDES